MKRDGRGLLSVAAAVFGLTGFVVAQPLFSVLGEGATFFLAHSTTPGELLAFTAAVVLLPPTLVGGVLAVGYVARRSAWATTVAVVIGLLLAAIVVPAVDRAVGLPTPLYLALALGVAVGGGLLYGRMPVVRSYTAATAFAPVLFAVLFLVASPASSIVSPSTSVAGSSAALDTDIVMLVFDEMPLAPLLDAEGGIDEVRFPNFARLAAISTWYPETSTVSPWTDLAVPALLTGNLPVEGTIPSASDYPRNLLRMLAPTHEVRAMETLTFLCGIDECAADRPKSRRQMVRDASVVFFQSFLPDGLADRWLPETGDRWSGFGGIDEVAPQFTDRDDWTSDALAAASLDQPQRVEQLLANLEAPGDRPLFVFSHLLLPHLPLLYLPDGSPYMLMSEAPPFTGVAWLDDQALVDASRQRFLLQMKYVDTIVGRVLDELDRTGRLEDTLVVVAADHGIVFQPGETRRGFPLTAQSQSEILPVPLFVHAPGQATGAVDRLPRQIIDVVPTIVDLLEVELPDDWAFEGRPLDDPDPRQQRDWADEAEIEPPVELGTSTAAAVYLEWFGEGRAEHDVYAWGPGLELVGEPTADHLGRADGGVPRSTLLTPAVEDRAAGDPVVPALVRYRIEGEPLADDWVAVSLNGVIAGVGPIRTEGGELVAEVMVDPALLRDGANDVEAHLLRDGTLVPFATT